MAAALVARDVTWAVGDRKVLDGCDLIVQQGDKIGLVGVNGSGKSTLLRILADRMRADSGTIHRTGRWAFLDQEPELVGETVADALAPATAWHRAMLDAYQEHLEAGRMDKAGRVQDQLDHVGWDVTHRHEAMLERLGAPPLERSLTGLSGGERRRVALARTLLSEPDVLLLDEPTNHLDAETAEWLQGWIRQFHGTLLLVTHDRYLLEAAVDRMVEVENGTLVPYEGSYADYLIARAERHASMARSDSRRMQIIAREAEWASRSPAARTTKSRSRLDRLEALKALPTFQARGSFSLDLSTGVKKGHVLVEAKHLQLTIPGRVLVDDLSFVLRPGDRIGILGPNGAGKSTLLRTIQGTRAPDSGVLEHGPRTQLAVLDQHRTGLPDTGTVFDAAGDGNDRVTIGENVLHVATFLERLLFPAAQFRQLVDTLSGGERARLLMARLMLKGANTLLLDEPTNDLDLLTLRVLEEALLGFDGAVVVVTHDRAFLDRVCTQVWAFEDDGQVTVYASRSQALAAAARNAEAKAEAQAAARAKEAAKPAQTRTRSGLSYKEKQELEALPERIEDLEAQVEALHLRLAEPAVWQDGASPSGTELQQQAAALEAQTQQAYARWETLAERDEDS